MRAEPDAATVERISTAVWDVVATRGIEGASVRAVAEAAGCTTGLIMHHFGSRAAMLVHARRLLFGRTTERANRAEAEAGDPVDRLRGVLAGSLTLDRARRDEARVWTGFAAASIADPELATVHVDGNRDWVGRIGRLLSGIAPDAGADQLRSGAIRLVALTDGLAALSLLDPDTYDAAAQAEALDRAIRTTINELEATR
ncbi:TetR/AcrR family transcriptional regulator [Promicromonospora sukumoe]|uniref:TetR/AcrR family transcriptional regulator n=1 Tax=Promicromonospora sukumoe TaxID=88382 RepID=UPI00039AD12F|nr:TetR/AcrR family transcriptional regulator [Promicromonospora sukumoe]